MCNIFAVCVTYSVRMFQLFLVKYCLFASANSFKSINTSLASKLIALWWYQIISFFLVNFLLLPTNFKKKSFFKNYTEIQLSKWRRSKNTHQNDATYGYAVSFELKYSSKNTSQKKISTWCRLYDEIVHKWKS